ncbi:MAG TPA: hypothetical protein VEE85_00175 [Candidatus Bathyarchaeia archaeon]|nr:hypothetical protein [Candidatus Bathyarchaeia archaeon]
MSRPERRTLERVQYWQGQMLRAQDFLTLQGVEAQRRWWHNRAIHNAYGIAEGLSATLIPANGPYTGVSVPPGVAYDIFGRELILERTLIIPLPGNVASNFGGAMSLLMRYKPPSRSMHPDEISEVCWTAPGSVIAGTAEFVWRTGDNLNPAEGVAVLAVSYSAGALTGPDPNYVQISAEPLSRPALASGATIPGQTSWELWTAGFYPIAGITDIPFPPVLVGVQTWIDTSAAGFTDVPCYFAWLQGPLWSSQAQQFLPTLLTNITDASIIGFTFQLVLPAPPPSTGGPEIARPTPPAAAPPYTVVNASNFIQFAQQQGLYVSWIGCQMPGKACSCSQDSVSATQGSAFAAKT